MPFSRRSNRTTSSGPCGPPVSAPPLCGICTEGEPDSVVYAEPTKAGIYTPRRQPRQQPRQQRRQRSRAVLPKTMSACTAATAATAATSRSLYSAASTVASEQDLCPVTGVFAHISDDYYVRPKVLGKGHYGIVRECVHLATRQEFAVKSIDKSKIGRLDHLQREIYLLANIDHRGIMKMVDCYEDAEFVHIITEKYTGGELFDQIVANTNSLGCLPERKAARTIKSLLEAVAYLHDNGIVHRDVKPENILFESDREDAAIRLIDFGLARRHGRGDEPMSNPVGTAYYMSPELLGGRYDSSCDIWAAGVVTYIMLSGVPPFNGRTDAEIQDSTLGRRLHFRGGQWLTKSDDAMDFIKCLLRRDPRRRLTARQALMHPWIRKI